MKKLIENYVKLIQKILLYLLLLLIYFFGFGLTKIFIFLFKKKLLKEKKYWQKNNVNLDIKNIYKPY